MAILLDDERRGKEKSASEPSPAAWWQALWARGEPVSVQDVDGESSSRAVVPVGLLGGVLSPSYVRVKGSERMKQAVKGTIPMTGVVVDDLPRQLPLLSSPGVAVRRRQLRSRLPVRQPIVLVEGGSDGYESLRLGSGARLDKRLLLFALLSLPRSMRRAGVIYRWSPPLRAIAGMLWKDWKPSKHARRLSQAFDAATLATVRLQDGRSWLPVVVRGRPDYRDPDSRCTFEIELPEGCGYGPMIDFFALMEYGRLSDPAFDLWLALAFLWDGSKLSNGGRRIYATRPKARRDRAGFLVGADGEVVRGHARNPFPGERPGLLVWRGGQVPQRDWRHPQAVIEGVEPHPALERLPLLTPADRRDLAYGYRVQKHKQVRQEERRTVDRLLRLMASHGRLVIYEDGRNWRVAETFPDVGVLMSGDNVEALLDA